VNQLPVGGNIKKIAQEYFEVKVHAIPVIDGSLITSEYDVLERLNQDDPANKQMSQVARDKGKLEASLLNDFELPNMILKKAEKYPRYARTLTLKRRKGSDDEDEAEE